MTRPRHSSQPFEVSASGSSHVWVISAWPFIARGGSDHRPSMIDRARFRNAASHLATRPLYLSGFSAINFLHATDAAIPLTSLDLELEQSPTTSGSSQPQNGTLCGLVSWDKALLRPRRNWDCDIFGQPGKVCSTPGLQYSNSNGGMLRQTSFETCVLIYRMCFSNPCYYHEDPATPHAYTGVLTETDS